MVFLSYPGVLRTAWLLRGDAFSVTVMSLRIIINREIVYTITVYATAPGYDHSEPAKLSFTVDRSDVNQDGRVDITDIATIIDKMAGK